MEDVYCSIEFFDQFKRKYSEYLRPEIVSVSIVYSDEAVWLEYIGIEITEDGFEKRTRNTMNLDFITDDSEDGETQIPFFNPEDSIEINVKKFIHELGPYSIVNTTDLFHEDARSLIFKKYEIFGIDK